MHPVSSFSRLLSSAILLGSVALHAEDAKPDAAGLEFFEKNVRPILTDRCYKCHSVSEGVSKGGLLMDSRAGMIAGGDQGPSVVPGDLKKSLLIVAIHQTDPELSMPPKKNGAKLPDAQIAILEKWIMMGAPAPAGAASVKLTGLSQKARDHWAFKPVGEFAVPKKLSAPAWCQNEIDAFILSKLDEVGLKPSPAADGEALIRRISYDLVGLPPSNAEGEIFARAYDAAVQQDNFSLRNGQPARAATQILERTVDKLLASPHYGERWGRHWLDTARYSDTKGLKKAGTIDRFENAWTYALGFITVGKRFTNNDDTIDERIDAMTKGFLGLTVACARCHDHKFDPIPAADYYSLHGIFSSIGEPLNEPVVKSAMTSGARATPSAVRLDYEKKMTALQDDNVRGYFSHVSHLLKTIHSEFAARALTNMAGGPRSTGGFDILERYKLTFNREVDGSILVQTNSPITGPLARLKKVSEKNFAQEAPKVIAAALADTSSPVNPLIADALRNLKPKTIDEVALACQDVFKKNHDRILAHIQLHVTAGRRADRDDPAIAQLAAYPWPLPNYEEINTTLQMALLCETRQFCEPWQAPPSASFVNNNKPAKYFRFEDISQLEITHPGGPGTAMVVSDTERPRDSYVYIRGDNADDFGNMSEKPLHPELLDWLATNFVDNGWSLKKLHKKILLSATYRQTANPSLNPLIVQKAEFDPTKFDSSNKYLWHANLRRLDFESIRDSMLSLTGKLDSTMGGRPVNITDEPYSYRRSIYGFIDREKLNELQTQFDFANPEMTNSARSSTIVPQQALFFMNNPLAIDVARSVAARPELQKAASDGDRVVQLYKIMYQRSPTVPELKMAREFVARIAGYVDEPPDAKPDKSVASTKAAKKAAKAQAVTTAKQFPLGKC
ncbi:MAG: DUF1553 domain-containing protein [Verrucomicrobia bacterium]|nr:DUF1553 domain-containing protein [Verrucomicrobiota bacterium]